MTNDPERMEIHLTQLLSALWRKAWLLSISMFLGAALSVACALFFVTPQYTASVLMYVNSSDSSLGGVKPSISQSDLNAAQSLIDTYTVILQTRTTLEDVIQQAQLPYTHTHLGRMIASESVNGTEVFRIRVTAPDPGESARIANTISQVLPEKIASIVEGSSTRVVDAAVVPDRPSSPNRLMFALMGMLLGLAASGVTVVIREMMDDRIHGSDALIRAFDMPLLASIPARNPHSRRGTLDFDAAEAYRLLRTNLNFSLPDVSGCKIIGITSTLREEGKSTTAIHTAHTMAQTGKKVLLLEADLRLPVIGRYLNLKPAPGLSNLLVGQCNGAAVLQEASACPGMKVICAGDVPPNPAELLNSEQMAECVRFLANHFDAIIVDLPPVSPVSDALIMSRLLSGMLLVVRENACTRSQVAEAIRKLNFTDCTLLGFVMTGDSSRQKSDYGYPKKNARQQRSPGKNAAG